MEDLSLDDSPAASAPVAPVGAEEGEDDLSPLEHGVMKAQSEEGVAQKNSIVNGEDEERKETMATAPSPPPPAPAPAAAAPVPSVPSGGGGHLVAPARSASGVSPRAAAEATGGASVADGGAFIGKIRPPFPSSSPSTSTTATNSAAAAFKTNAASFAQLMRSRAKAASERAAASIKAADLGSAWHGAVDAAGAALAATEEKIRKIGAAASAVSSASPYLSPSSASLSSICKAEASSRPCPRLALVACSSIAAEASRAASERAFVADVPLELAGFVLAELEDSAGVALPPPGTSPAIMATALKHFLTSLPDPLLPAKCLPDFIGAGVKGAPPSAAARAASALPPAPAAVLSLLVETMSRIATAGGGEIGGGEAPGAPPSSIAGAPTPLELAESLVPCISWHPGAPKPTVSPAPSSAASGGSADGGSGRQQFPPSAGAAGGSSPLSGRQRAELTPGEAAAVARAVEILILTAADRAAGGGGFSGGGGFFGGGGGGGSFGGSSFGGDSEPASPMGFFGGAAGTAAGGDGAS